MPQVHCRNAPPTLLLVMPPQHWLLEGFTSGLVALANYTTQHLPSATVKFVDLSHIALIDLPRAARAHLADTTGPVVVGITTTTATYQSSLAVARAFKTIDREIQIILGGHHSNTEDEIILRRRPEIDFVIRGEGERGMVDFLTSFPHVDHVPGLSYRSALTVVRNPGAPKLGQDELDRLSIEFQGLDVSEPLGRCNHVTYVSARGCPLTCSFCAVAREQIRAKSIGQVVKDLELLVGKYVFRKIGIEDNFFAQSKTRTLALCCAIVDFRRANPDLYFTWDCQTRVESMTTPELVHGMAAAGCDGVFLGVENFDPEILGYLNKTRDPDHYVSLLLDRVLPLILETKMTCFLNFQMGTAIEGRRHIEHNLAYLRRVGTLARRAGTRAILCPMLSVIYPGTYLFSTGVASRRFPRDIFESFTSWEAEQEPVRKWLGRHFAHGTGGLPDGILEVGGLAQKDFRPDGSRLLQIESYFDDLHTIEGLEVFDYEPYLVRD